MIDELIKDLSLSQTELKTLVSSFERELVNAFNNEESCLGCYNTCVALPLVKKNKGVFIAIDLGGSNLRVALCKRDKNGIVIVKSRKETLNATLMTHSVDYLFEYIVDICVSILDKAYLEQPISVGFTFSFRVEQFSIQHCIIKQWNKGYHLPVDFDPVQTIQSIFYQKGFSNINVDCLINDTTATLLTNYWVDSNCDIALILGTGTNICLAVPVKAVSTDFLDKNQHSVVYNLESGNFNVSLPRTTIDEILDKESLNPGVQLEEKMVAGLYLGKLVSLALNVYFTEKKSDCHWPVEQYLTSTLVGQFQIVDDIVIKEHFRSIFDFELEANDIEMIRQLSRLITDRSAQIAATLIVASLQFLDSIEQKRHVVAVDGSLYSAHPRYKKVFQDTVYEFLNDFSSPISFLNEENASLLGSALLID
tara:strand:- start:3758 stop:5023 length:1266 start_codon:yes stop_codon:yes gene_type:complete